MKKRVGSVKRSFVALLATFALMIGLFPVTSAFAAVAVPTEGKIHAYKLDFGASVPTLSGNGTKQDSFLTGSSPVVGATFRAVLVAPGDVSTTAPTQTWAESYYASHTANLAFEGVTNSDGLFETPLIPAGQYLLYQHTLTGTDETSKAAPIIITIPMMNPDGLSWNSDVWVYTKDAPVLGAASLYKYDGEGTKETTPLGSAMFDLYYNADNDTDWYDDELVAVDLMTASTTNATTGAVAGFTPTVGHLNPGNYYFIETGAPSGYLLKDKKYTFTIGDTNHAYTPEGELIDAKVVKVGSVADTINNVANYPAPTIARTLLTRTSADIGEINTWSITGTIPKDITDYDEFLIADFIPPELTYIGNLQVTAGGQALDTNAYRIELPSSGNGYELYITFVDNYFTPAYSSLLANRNFEITYNTKMNNASVPGVKVPNKATLWYDNGTIADDYVTSEPTVETGAQLFKKVSNTMQALSGAEFRIYKTEGVQKLYVKQDTSKNVTWVSDPTQATKFVSPATGKFSMIGLGYGTYQLEETKAPATYQLMSRDADFTITAASTIAAGTINIINTSAPIIPVTGGMGTIIFFAGGGMLMLLALVVLRKKKHEDEEEEVKQH